jgi:methyltransferase (TIGR00027 family)
MRLLLPRELHETDRPSVTAQWTTVGRALELERPVAERIVDDALAPYFLTPTSRRVLGLLRAGAPLLHAAERRRVAGIATSALCRHRSIEEYLLAALPGTEQVLLLGAGYDTRAYRLHRQIAARPVFEIDLAAISRRKATIVAAHPEAFGTSTVHRVEIDFRTESLADKLRSSGMRAGAPTAVVWEGVAMYLVPDAITATLDTLAGVCGAGSLLTMDCWQRVAGWRPYDQVRKFGEQAFRLAGEPITFTARPVALRALLAEHGFAVTDVATSDVLTDRYATAGRTCDEGLYVLAADRR